MREFAGGGEPIGQAHVLGRDFGKFVGSGILHCWQGRAVRGGFGVVVGERWQIVLARFRVFVLVFLPVLSLVLVRVRFAVSVILGGPARPRQRGVDVVGSRLVFLGIAIIGRIGGRIEACVRFVDEAVEIERHFDARTGIRARIPARIRDGWGDHVDRAPEAEARLGQSAPGE